MGCATNPRPPMLLVYECSWKCVLYCVHLSRKGDRVVRCISLGLFYVTRLGEMVISQHVVELIVFWCFWVTCFLTCLCRVLLFLVCYCPIVLFLVGLCYWWLPKMSSTDSFILLPISLSYPLNPYPSPLPSASPIPDSLFFSLPPCIFLSHSQLRNAHISGVCEA